MTGSQDAADVVVIGGGIAGMSAAFELAGTGLEVVLVEREPTLEPQLSPQRFGAA